jgi:acyl carrier protein
MDHNAEVREFFKRLLAIRHDRQPFTDTTSFFLSGRLSSVDAVELVVFLEEKYGIDFADIGFDQSQIDSVEAIGSLLRTVKAVD